MYAKSLLLVDGAAAGQDVAGATSKYCALTSPSSAPSSVLPLRMVDDDKDRVVSSEVLGN